MNGQTPLLIEAFAGAATVIVGANGSGKSALAIYLTAKGGPRAYRVAAHRRIWFETGGADITRVDRDTLRRMTNQSDIQPKARWKDDYSDQRPSLALFDLLAKTHGLNARLSEAVRGGTEATQVMNEIGPTPIDVLNDVLARAKLPIVIQMDDVGDLQASKGDSSPYPVSEMSDGEKNALLMAAEVLVAAQGSVLVIDEPERHLHRSISGGLVASLVAARPDCHLVLATHDLDLVDALDGRVTTRLLTYGCTFPVAGAMGGAWDLEKLESDGHIPDEARTAVLGGRKKVLFVEGSTSSLDRPLFELLYPESVTMEVGGCEEVIRATKGVRESNHLHWISAEGIVDRDRRTDQEVAGLESAGIRVLKLHEVENLYYLSTFVRAVAEHQAVLTEDTAEVLTAAALKAGLRAIAQAATREHLAVTVAFDSIRRRVLDQVPHKETIKSGNVVSVTVDNFYASELASIEELIAAEDYDGILERYPIRESSFRNDVAKVLRLPKFEDYESAVRMLLRNDSGLRATARSFIGTATA